MRQKILILFFVSFLLYFYSYAQSADTVKNPLDDYIISLTSDSLLQNPAQHSICKITADFNSDGIEDIAISDWYLCGANGCDWKIYLGLGNEAYKFFSELWFSNYAIRIDSVRIGVSNIYTYNKTGLSEGDIVEYNLSSSKGITKIDQKTIYPETYPENDDYKYYKNIFTQPEIIETCINLLEYLKTNK
jgi:hypothetical protein